MRLLLSLIVVFTAFVMLAAPAQAQNCDLVHEMIAKLRRPQLGAYNLWDHIEGERAVKDRYADAVIIPESGQAVMIMERDAGAEQEGGKTLLLQEIDRRGRSEWIKELDVENVSGAKKLMLWKDQLIVLANITEGERRAVWIGYFSKTGDFQRELVLKDQAFDLSVNDAVAAHDGKTLLLAMQNSAKNFNAKPSTILYWINDKGRVVKDRAFMLGLENEISSIQPVQDGRYIMAGSIETANGSMAGWLVYIDGDGALRWQRQYARGRGSRFTALTPFASEKYVALIGDALPGGLDGGRRSGWAVVAALSDGEPAWQRYYREDADVYGRGIDAQGDGQITILMGVEQNDDTTVDDYLRLVTLNPRGVILSSRSYQNGVGANAAGMIAGNKHELVIYGASVIAYTEKETQPDGIVLDKEVRSQEAWAVAAAPNEIYSDPCAHTK